MPGAAGSEKYKDNFFFSFSYCSLAKFIYLCIVASEQEKEIKNEVVFVSFSCYGPPINACWRSHLAGP